MTELMYHHRLKPLIVCHGEIVGIEDTATSVFLRVHQYDDVLVRRASQPVVQVLEIQCRQVSVTIEGIEVRVEGGLLPNALGWFARTAFLRR